jgi:hypothetical protein
MSITTLILVSIFSAAPAGFDDERPGAVPRGWTVAMTNDGGPPKWEILRDPTAPSGSQVLAQTSTDATNARYPLAIYQRAELANGSVSVRYKTISGGRDQAAGIVWRYRDPGNYYIVRANALEDNVVLYKVEAGKRVSLAPVGTAPGTYGVKHPVPKQTWTTLRVDFSGPRFEVFLNGARIMEVRDETFSAAGLTGLWTKADSVTHFDDYLAETR